MDDEVESEELVYGDELSVSPEVFRFLFADHELANGWAVRAMGSDAAARTTLFVASTADEDRALDVVKQDWRLRNYRGTKESPGNPVVLDNHDGRRVVGRGDRVAIPKDTGNLEILVRWDLDNPDPSLRAVGHQHLNGFRSAGSVGFRSGRITQRDKLAKDHPSFREPATLATAWGEFKWAGLLYEQNELLEFSSASIPMNPLALHRPERDGGDKGLQLADHLRAIDDPLLKAITIARETTPRLTADELVAQCCADPAVLRRVVGWFEAQPAPRRTPSPATPASTPRAPVGDGLDHLFP